MKKSFAVLFVPALVLAIGCKPADDAPPVAPVENGVDHADHGHGHDHGDGEHRHGDGHTHDHSVEGHVHGPGPHDGTIVDWGGGKFHVEFTVSHEEEQATVYVLGADEKTPSPIDTETIELNIVDPAMQVTLEAAPLDSDPEGTASRFIGKHESLGVVQEYQGTITGVVDGTPYAGDFQEEAHNH